MPDPLHKLAKIVNDSCRYPANEVGAFLDSVAADAVRPVVLSYQHRPAPSGLHAKFLRELSKERSEHYTIRPAYHLPPNSIAVWLTAGLGTDPLRATDRVWSGHRDSMPACYRGAADPYRCLSTPASD